MNHICGYLVGRLKKYTAVIGCSFMGVLSSQYALGQCNGINDVEGTVFLYPQGSPISIDTFSGEVENVMFDGAGWIRATLEEPNAATLPVLHIQEDLNGDVLQRSSWRYVTFDQTTLGSLTHFSFANVGFTPQEVPDGGLGRYRGLVAWFNDCLEQYQFKAMKTYVSPRQPSLGIDSMGYQMYSGLVSDVDPKPHQINSNAFLGLGRCKFDPTASGCAGTPVSNIGNETKQYYDQVKISPNGTGTQSISNGLPNLQAFHNRYFSTGKELVAEYYNKGDLGIGREMHCNFTAPGERACYVKNFAPCAEPILNGTACLKPIFGDRVNSKAAQISGVTPFATVAMVERQAIAPSQPDSTFFAVYVCTEGDCSNLANHKLYDGPVALDNHGIAGTGSNTFNPGNCLVCHGAGGRYDAVNNQTYGAYFLPFDTRAFEDLSSNNTLRDQHDIFREMNGHIATESHLKDVANARRLIEYWYMDDNGQVSFDTGSFNSARAPTEFGFEGTTVRGATTLEASGAIYNSVYGKACRGCHITHPSLQLSEFSTWEILGPTLFKSVICGDSTDSQGRPKFMPLAERTQEIVWDEHVRNSFFQNLGIADISCDAVGGS